MSEAKIPCSDAPQVIPFLKSKGWVDLSARISSDGDHKLVPILNGHADDVTRLGFEVVCGPAYSEASRPPMERISDSLSVLSPGELEALPDKWEIAGDTVSIKLDPSLFEYGQIIGETYARVLGMRTVLADVSGVSGEFREPDMKVLFGVSGESVKLENGIRYCFDATKVMFASGNLVERKRMKELDCNGETVIDMFAGIGYFSLPLAKFSGARRVISCEKNPASYRYLVKNLALNGINNIIPILGDNRSIPGKHFADRILMGYVQTTSSFLPKALDLAKPECIIHYHDTFPVGKQGRMLGEIFDQACGRDGYEVLSMREVKSFAPSVSHYVADIRVFRSNRFARTAGHKQGVHAFPILVTVRFDDILNERFEEFGKILIVRSGGEVQLGFFVV